MTALPLPWAAWQSNWSPAFLTNRLATAALSSGAAGVELARHLRASDLKKSEAAWVALNEVDQKQILSHYL